MAGKMSSKFIALCSLAVGAIYSTGYSITAANGSALAAPASQPAQSASTGAVKQSGSSNATSGTSGQTGTSHRSGGTGAVASPGSSSNRAASSHATGSSNANTPTKPAAKPVNTTQQYLDGTYQGSASNRIGMVSVAVSISRGKISNVQITACDTHYPQSYIDPVLPNYVEAHQTTNIPIVSGATLSTADFYYAVVQALSQAQNPHYKG
ncbi:FMN-binding protein [Alicyclobacillus tolerans]|uniref:FMN-binding protein n=1 Tax=Alicyclobacillus tolerans TaxID=90970 RepID=UPI001F24FA80|nr:FMN-binding protein [Alicyclobacillus tolerans]MCF8565417.1 FMN-binding protein [Alicyclobacillus tolerans]